MTSADQRAASASRDRAASASDARVLRVAGRVLVLDRGGCVLLLEHRVDLMSEETVWAAPGGGCEPGERPLDAAVRELAEECGLRLTPQPDHPITSERRAWTFDGVAYDQTDHFFLARVIDRPEVDPTRRTDWEARTVLGHRWFSAAELRTLATRFEPAHLPQLLDELAAGQR